MEQKFEKLEQNLSKNADPIVFNNKGNIVGRLLKNLLRVYLWTLAVVSILILVGFAFDSPYSKPSDVITFIISLPVLIFFGYLVDFFIKKIPHETSKKIKRILINVGAVIVMMWGIGILLYALKVRLWP